MKRLKAKLMRAAYYSIIGDMLFTVSEKMVLVMVMDAFMEAFQ